MNNATCLVLLIVKDRWVKDRWGLFALARQPAAANRKYLPDKATRWFATKVSSKLSVLSCAYEAPQRNLALQALLEPRIALNVGREVGRVINEVLRDCIHLNIVGSNLHADGLHVGKLGAAGSAVCRGALYPAQR